MAGIQDDDFVADINVTPFVDVMLVLLVIFMVTAPMMTEGLEVDLPGVKAAEVLPTEDEHMILSVKADGSLFLDDYPTTPDDLESVLRHLVVPQGKQLFLKADKQVPYGVVMDVMGRVRAVGITSLGMVAESLPGENAAHDTPEPAENIPPARSGTDTPAPSVSGLAAGPAVQARS